MNVRVRVVIVTTPLIGASRSLPDVLPNSGCQANELRCSMYITRLGPVLLCTLATFCVDESNKMRLQY